MVYTLLGPLRSYARLGGVQTLIPDDACHDVMISEP